MNDRIGKGRLLDLSGTPDALLVRMTQLQAALGYGEELAPSADDGKETAARVDVTSIAELFAHHVPRQLSRFGDRLSNGVGAFGIAVIGTGGGTWTIRLDGASAQLVSGEADAPWSLQCESADLLDVANRRMTVAQFRTKVGLRGDAAQFDRLLSERLMWILFGDDIRPYA
jgi:hypothetical protein